MLTRRPRSALFSPSTTVGPAHRNSRLGPKSSCLQRVSYTCGGCVPAPLQVVSTGIGTESLEGVAEQWSTRVNRAAARRTRVLSEALRPSTSPTTQIRQRHAVVLCAVMNRRMFLANFVMLVLAGCGARAPVRSTPDRYVRRGLASWYGDAFDGKLTASGEPFDSNQFTTAHYDLPFDSRVRVRNLNNDREVELRVNDRVPLDALNNGRILDVSYAAARQLEMVEDGVVPIEITVVAWGPSR